MNFEGQMTGYGPANTEVPAVEKRNFLNSTSRSDKLFPAESSGKGENSFVISNKMSDVVPSFYRGNFGDNLQGVSGVMISQHQHHMANTQQGVMFTEKEVQFAETNTMLFQSGGYPFRDPISFSSSLEREDVTFQKPGLNNSQSSFYRTEPSHQSHTSVGKYPQLPNSQHLMYGLSSQADAGKILSYASEDAVFREKVPMNFNSTGVINPTMTNFPPLNSVSFHPVSAPQGSANSTEFSKPGMYGTELGNTEAKFDGGNFSGNVCYVGTPIEAVNDSCNMDMSGLANSTFNITAPPQTSAVMERNQAGSQYRPKTEGQSLYYEWENAGASFGANNQEKKESGIWGKPSDSKTTLLDYGRINGSSNEAHASRKTDDSDGMNGNNLSKEEASQKIDTSVNKSAAPHEKRSSLSMDSTSKLPSIKVAPRITENLWDGTLQLNTSTVVSAVAVFKSGEKVSEVNWSKFVEVKGKVRLEAFEKFVQELPRSRTRALMVISIYWKVGSSETGLMGMKEVAKGYKEGQRVGFAQLCPGIDLYVCPRSDAIITILAKYGFFKGMAAVEEDQDSLIGCVIWRRSHSSSDSALKKSDKNEFLLQPLDSPESDSPNNADQSSLITKTVDSGSNQVTPGLKVPAGTSSSVNPSRSETESTNDIQNIRSTNVSINVTSNNDNATPVLTPLSTQLSSFTSQLPISVQKMDTPAETLTTLPMHVSSITPQISMSVQMIDTSAGDVRKFTSTTTTPFGHYEAQKNPQAGLFEPSSQLVSGPSQKLQDNHERSADNNDDDDLPEFDFGNAYGISVLPKNWLPSPSNIPCPLEPPPHKRQLTVKINGSPSVISSLELPNVRPLPPNDGLRGQYAPSYFGLMHPSQNVLKEVGAASHGLKVSAKIIETSSSLGGSGIDKNSDNPTSKSFFAPEIVETMGPASKSVASEEQNSTNQAAKSFFVQKRPIWDDDDMPEWCPPNVDSRQMPPMPVLSPPPLQPMSCRAPSPFWAPPSVTTPSWSCNPPPPQPPFWSHYDQNISHQHQSRILPRRPLDSNHKTAMETMPATRFGRPEWRASPESYPSQTKRQRRVSGWDVKPWEVKPDS